MIALIYGGLSKEKEISVQTACFFEEQLKSLNVEFVKIEGGLNLVEDLKKNHVSKAILAVHGLYAEDGVVQSICEFLKIPYTGSGVLASALCMNKNYCNRYVKNLNLEGLKIPKFVFVDVRKAGWQKKIENLPFQSVVVKPSREGSSLGVSILESFTQTELEEVIQETSQFDSQILLQERICGQEVFGSYLLGHSLTLVEAEPKQGFYDFHNKYTPGHTNYYIPARISNAVVEKVKSYTIDICKALSLRQYARVDYIYSKSSNEISFLEVNTLPGFTKKSLLPQAALYDGLDLKNVVQELLDSVKLDYGVF